MLRYNYTTRLILFLSLFINSCISDTIENNSINYESKDINVIKEKINFVLTNHYNYNGNKFSINDTSSGCIDLDKCSLLGTYTDTINITGYGDCKAVVQWDQYWCYRDLNPGMSGSIEFDNFTAYPLAGSCDSVFMAWYNYETNNMLEQLEEDLTAFVYSAQETIRHRELGIFFENLKPFIECGIGNFLLSTRVFTSNCKKNCYKLTLKKGKPLFEFSTVLCDESCCIEIIKYCWDRAIDELVESEPEISSGGNCPLLSVNVHSCPSGFFPLSETCLKDCYSDNSNQ